MEFQRMSCVCETYRLKSDELQRDDLMKICMAMEEKTFSITSLC